MKVTILALAFAISTFTARCEDTQTPVYRLLEKINFKQSAIDSARSMFQPFLQGMKDQGIPDEAMKEIADAADRFFEKTYSNPLLFKEIADAYSKIFTDDEIEELILFYETPLGQKSIVTMPQVMGECAEIAMKHAQKHQEGFQKEIAGILEKHQPAAEEPDEVIPNEEHKPEE